MDFICSDKPAVVVGFMYGFVESMANNGDSLESPLSSVVVAGINGLIYGGLAGLVSGLVLPVPAKPLLPAILMLSAYKKHGHMIPSFMTEVKQGADKAMHDITENGSQKLTDLKNDVSDAIGIKNTDSKV
jgi:hypothetical protein